MHSALVHISFVVPGKPQPKQRARKGVSWSGKVIWYTPKETVIFEKSVAWQAMFALAQHEDWPKDAKYKISVFAFFPDSRRRDFDNVIKSVLDGMNKLAYHNDSQVVDHGESGKRVDALYPRTEVRLEVIA